MYYEKLQLVEGVNIFKYGFLKFIVDYVKEYINLYFIICNFNCSKNGRFYLLNELFLQNEYVCILVYFDILDDVFYERVV